jgi:hypothetical protein
MSQTVTYTEYSDPAIASKVQDRESLISKIIAKLNVIAKIRRPQFSARTKHQNFIDANLLDEVMGPEISRTLRR